MALKSYLQLVRLPNLFTASADSLTGWLLVMGTFAQPFRWLGLMTASVCLYASGVVLNDLRDLSVDQRERPYRPLPSGQVRVATARTLALVLLVAGFGLAVWAGGTPHAHATTWLLVGSVLAYSTPIKETIFGPLAMGSCRACNVLLGMSVLPGWGGPVCIAAAAAYGVFVAGITWISRAEVETGATTPIKIGLAFQDVAFLVFFAVVLAFPSFPAMDRPASLPVGGLLVVAIIALVVNVNALRSLETATPKTVQSAVKTSILSLVWLNAAVVLAVRGGWPACAVAALWFPSFVSGKWLYST